MKRHRMNTSVASPKPTSRTGATLTEILMALMIMGIGVTSVATLFPYAIMRSVRATQLTNAALLRYQVDEIVDLAPTIMPFNMPLANSDTAAIGAGPAMFSGFPLGPNSVRVHIVDPLGYYKSGNGNIWDPTRNLSIRSSGNFTAAAAQDFCVLNDSWVTQWSGVAEGINPARTVVTFPETARPTLQTVKEILTSRIGSGSVNNPQRPGLRVRVLCTSVDGKTMQSQNLTNPANVNETTGTVTFSTALPDNGSFDALQDVFIQVFETRYSWMITATTRLIAPGDDGVPGVPEWQDDMSGVTYGVDDWVRNTDSSINRRFLRCVAGGTPGSSVPSFNNTTPVGSVLTDGTVTWVVSDQPDTGDTVTTEMDLVVFFRRDFTSVAERTLTTQPRMLPADEIGQDEFGDEVVVNYGGFDPKPTFVENQWVFVTSIRRSRGVDFMTRGEWAQIRRVLNDDVSSSQAQLQFDRKVWTNRDPRNTTLTVFIPDGVLDVYPLGIVSSED